MLFSLLLLSIIALVRCSLLPFTFSKMPDVVTRNFPILAAAAVTGTLMYPFDVIRTLKMANAGSGLSTRALVSDFVASHGVRGFFQQGIGPEIAKATYSRFLKFSIFPVLHAQLNGGNLPKFGTPQTRAIAALLASIPESISIMPLEVAKINLQMDKVNAFNNKMFSALSHVSKTRGLKGFGIGYTGIQLRQAAWTSVYFSSVSTIQAGVEEMVGRCGVDPNAPGVKPACQFVGGFLAGVLGTCFNTPFDTIRSVVQKRAFSNPAVAAPTFMAVGKELVAKNGVGCLYNGFQAKAIHLGGGGALMAMFIPLFTRMVTPKMSDTA